MEAILVAAVVCYSLALLFGVAMLFAVFTRDDPPVPEEFPRPGWVEVSVERTVETPANEIVEYIVHTGTGGRWVLGSTGVEIENAKLLPGDIVGDVMRSDDKTIMNIRAELLESRVEVIEKGEAATIRVHTQFQRPAGVRKVISIAFLLRPRLRGALQDWLELLPSGAGS